MERISTMRLYGAAIALVSGAYSVWLSTTGMGMTTSAWFMLALGLVVVTHGVVLLTPFAHVLGRASGPLMLGYATVMLANQWLMSMGSGGMMRSGMMTGSSMGTDAGMVAIAVLMLASGAIMTTRQGMLPTGANDEPAEDSMA